MLDFIEVSYKCYSTKYSISKILDELSSRSIMSLDFEVQSIYSLEEKAEAKELLKCCKEEMSLHDMKLTKLVQNSSGLSHPSIVKSTHIIFGLSNSESVILIIYDAKTEQMVMDWVVEYEGKLLIHNSGFDVKLIHQRTGKFPKDYEDTQLAAKCLINHCDTWKANSGLKELMGSYYDPKWTMIDTYDIVDYKNEAFLRYSSIDGAATFKLWEDLQEHLVEEE